MALKNDSSNGNENEKKDKNSEENKEYYGFDKYPDRRSYKPGADFWSSISGKVSDKVRCEKNVLKAVKRNPVIKLLIDALNNSGCPFDLARNVCCEPCDLSVTGGYDIEMNQIVVCQNSIKASLGPDVTLVHELIHMFDNCVNEVDFKNINHLACTEIRAANLTHCSFLSSLLLAQSGPFHIKETHKNCVKMKAVQSVMIARQMDFKTAYEHVDRVFNKCYNDLEPIGRRIRRNSYEGNMAYDESAYYGYSRGRNLD